ncbi:SpoIIIAH-like family protein [Paenibacillus sp. YN15]|uniref:SpoIIIAH-like family protein n=1 Tax=Paenibacillus sp. YN15 TaxID=1742774 RepID=UPI000DCB4DCA|nr:SpoIIIAH-like family protein [Paenibacillus sp. YN15]RAV00975.1 mutants block sporulation after engulfment (stage III sporulation) [Paenibacillus sp. YN15]
MNTKRQTIWLVSMLSLMVVLSAYYLFTEDVDKLNTATEKAVQQEIKVTTEEKTPQEADKAVGGVADSSAADSAKSAQTQTADKTKAADSAQTTDAQVLEKVASKAVSGSDYFADLVIKRNEDLGKRVENLANIISDTKKSADEIAKASDDFDRIQTMQAKVESLEDILGQTYSNAVVLDEGDKFRTVVQVANKLDAKQAQTIIDLMIKELGVTKEAVSVQYIK